MLDPARHAQWPLRSKRMTSASRTQKQNVWSGFTLVSQSVSCCHAGKCILVFSKDLLTKYIVFCSSNLSGYLTHLVEWTGAIWPSSSYRSPENFTSRETWHLLNESQWISANIDALPCTVNCRSFLQRSAWNWTIKCVLTTIHWTGPLEQRLTVSKNCNRLPWEI